MVFYLAWLLQNGVLPNLQKNGVLKNRTRPLFSKTEKQKEWRQNIVLVCPCVAHVARIENEAVSGRLQTAGEKIDEAPALSPCEAIRAKP
jgi:hypothetical protein